MNSYVAYVAVTVQCLERNSECIFSFKWNQNDGSKTLAIRLVIWTFNVAWWKRLKLDNQLVGMEAIRPSTPLSCTSASSLPFVSILWSPVQERQMKLRLRIPKCLWIIVVSFFSVPNWESLQSSWASFASDFIIAHYAKRRCTAVCAFLASCWADLRTLRQRFLTLFVSCFQCSSSLSSPFCLFFLRESANVLF